MKSRFYYASIADARLDAEEANADPLHESIFEFLPACITLWYIIMAMIAPKEPRPMITKEERPSLIVQEE